MWRRPAERYASPLAMTKAGGSRLVCQAPSLAKWILHYITQDTQNLFKLHSGILTLRSGAHPQFRLKQQLLASVDYNGTSDRRKKPEFRGIHSDIAELVKSVTTHKKVNVCLSNRVLLIFDCPFEGLPGLILTRGVG
jgi:hypothetical protein